MMAGIAKFSIHISEVMAMMRIGSALKKEKTITETEPFNRKSKAGKMGTTEVSAYIAVMHAKASIYVMSI